MRVLTNDQVELARDNILHKLHQSLIPLAEFDSTQGGTASSWLEGNYVIYRVHANRFLTLQVFDRRDRSYIYKHLQIDFRGETWKYELDHWFRELKEWLQERHESVKRRRSFRE